MHQSRPRVRRLGLIGLAFVLGLATDNRGTSAEELTVAGLNEPVEVLRDRWGIAHIYARDEHDLFFAQGFNVARDRLFQLELWRRQATGTLAEIQGPRALPRDIGARLLRFRGDMAARAEPLSSPGRGDRRGRSSRGSTPTSSRPSASRRGCRSSSASWGSGRAGGRPRSSSPATTACSGT